MTASVLYDAPGPRARRTTTVVSTLLGLLVLLGLYRLAYRPLDDNGQFEGELWSPLLNPSDPLFSLVWQRLRAGFTNTLTAAALAILSSLAFGTLLAVLRARLHDRARTSLLARGLDLVTRVVVEVFRGLPVLLTIFAVSRILPAYGLDLSVRALLVIGLTLYNMVVIGEILRSGMANLPPGQREAAEALGLSGLQTVLLVLLPQSFRVMLPALISQVVVVLKDTSLGFIISYEEALRVGGQIIQNLSNPIQVYAVIGAIYVAVNYGVSRLAQYAQRRVSAGRRRPATGLAVEAVGGRTGTLTRPTP